MDRTAFNAHCTNLPATTCEASFGPGHDVWKIGGKMFAIMGTKSEGITLKCADPDTAAHLIDMGRAEVAPYLKRGGWIFVRDGTMEADELTQRLTTAYLTVRRALTKKAQAELPPEPQG